MTEKDPLTAARRILEIVRPQGPYLIIQNEREHELTTLALIVAQAHLVQESVIESWKANLASQELLTDSVSKLNDALILQDVALRARIAELEKERDEALKASHEHFEDAKKLSMEVTNLNIGISNIAQAFGCTTPLEVIGRAENNEERLHEIFARMVKERTVETQKLRALLSEAKFELSDPRCFRYQKHQDRVDALFTRIQEAGL